MGLFLFATGGDIELMKQKRIGQGALSSGKSSFVQVIGLLPAFYIGTSFFNFSVGAVLGMLMTLNQNWWGLIVPFHAELNPYGWLTLLIYGMTYAVLKWFANIVSPRPILGWIQLVMAEGGVICITLSHLASSLLMLQIGMMLQALAPILFLVNILLSIAAKRRRKRTETPLTSSIAIYVEEIAAAGYPITEAMRRVYGTLGDTRRHYETDSVAQRGTDMALMLFVVCAVWASISSWLAGSISEYAVPFGANILTYYGWIAGTVVAVSMHLYQRYSSVCCLSERAALIGQVLWILGVILSTAGFVFLPVLIPIGSRLLGLGLAWIGFLYLKHINRVFQGVKHPVHIAWKLSSLCLFLLGMAIVAGASLMDLFIFHLMFLGWMTMLVYGVGYTFFPLLLRRTPRSIFLANVQIWAGLVGVLFMICGFYCMENGLLLHESTFFLAFGGVCAAAGALYFLIQWPFGKQVGPT
jgi:energy-converting hydrogenase Eha subunit C